IDEAGIWILAPNAQLCGTRPEIDIIKEQQRRRRFQAIEDTENARQRRRHLAAYSDPPQLSLLLRRKNLNALQIAPRGIGKRFDPILDLSSDKRIVRSLQEAILGRLALFQRGQFCLPGREVAGGALIAHKLVLKLLNRLAARRIFVVKRCNDTEIEA